MPTPKYRLRQDLILDTAAQLFNQRGVKGATLADVAEAVGLITHSVTYYFRRKEDLAAACFMRSIECLTGLVTEAASEVSPAARLKRLLADYFVLLAQIARRERADIMVFRDLRALPPAQAAAVHEAYNNLFRQLRELLWPSGGQPGSPHGNARTHLVLSAINGARIWIDAFDPEDFGRVAAHMHDLLAGGLSMPGVVWNPPRLSQVGDGGNGASDGNAERFLQAASVLINDQGYKGASVEKISAALNVTKGSFYHHNNAKDDLVARCFDRSFDVIRDALDAGAALPLDGWTRLSAIAAHLVRFQLSPQGPLLRNTGISALPPELRGEVLRRMARLSGRFADLLVDATIDGSVRPLDPRIAADMLHNAVNAAAELDRWVGGVDAEAAPGIYIRPLMQGVFRP